MKNHYKYYKIEFSAIGKLMVVVMSMMQTGMCSFTFLRLGQFNPEVTQILLPRIRTKWQTQQLSTHDSSHSTLESL